MGEVVLVDVNYVDREYGFEGTEAIIDHPKYGRILIIDAFGGNPQSPEGMCVRWKHGAAVKLLPDDDFESLENDFNEYTTIFSAAIRGYDPQRPVLGWRGHMIENVAKSVGL